MFLQLLVPSIKVLTHQNFFPSIYPLYPLLFPLRLIVHLSNPLFYQAKYASLYRLTFLMYSETISSEPSHPLPNRVPTASTHPRCITLSTLPLSSKHPFLSPYRVLSSLLPCRLLEQSRFHDFSSIRLPRWIGHLDGSEFFLLTRFFFFYQMWNLLIY